jgi:hypothetical protein
MNGDAVKRSTKQALISVAALIQCVQAQPANGWFGITNAASYYSEEGREETVVGEIARGAMFVIPGSNLGPAEAQTAQDSPLATELELPSA